MKKYLAHWNWIAFLVGKRTVVVGLLLMFLSFAQRISKDPPLLPHLKHPRRQPLRLLACQQLSHPHLLPAPVKIIAVQIILSHADQNPIGAASQLVTAARVVQYGWFLKDIVPFKDGRDADMIIMDVAALVSACSGTMVIAFLA